MDSEQKQAYKDAYYAYDQLRSAYGKTSAWYQEHWEKGGKAPDLSELSSAEKKARSAIETLAKKFGYDGSLRV